MYSTYDFDDANRLTQITDNTSGVYSFGYDVLNRMTSRTLPNGVTTTTDYDGLGRIKFYKNVSSSAGTLNDYNFTYNNLPRIEGITEPSRTRSFTYDNSDRLATTTSSQSGQNESYSYDAVGNRTASHLSTSYSYQTGAFNRLTSTQTASYTYDANGNMISKSDSNGQWNYFYDYENRLASARKFGGLMPRAGESVNYQYDALGRRVSRQDKKSGRTEFTLDGLDVIQDRFEKQDGTNSTTNYINGLGIDDKLKQTTGTTTRYFLTDHLGSTVGLSDTNGAVINGTQTSYDSFGRASSTTLQNHTRYGFTGRETDEKTGLMYYRARQYDPQIGRFTTEDPIGFAGGDVNLYGYVLNNPVSYFDSEGTQIRSDRNRPGDKEHAEGLRRQMESWSKSPIGFGCLMPLVGSPIIGRCSELPRGKVYLCSRVADLPLNSLFGFRHYWIVTDQKSGGLGVAGEGVPGQRQGQTSPDFPYLTKTTINDHTSECNKPDTECVEVMGADPNVINERLQIGANYGGFDLLSNNCRTVACDILYPPQPSANNNKWNSRSWGGGGRGW